MLVAPSVTNPRHPAADDPFYKEYGIAASEIAFIESKIRRDTIEECSCPD